MKTKTMVAAVAAIAACSAFAGLEKLAERVEKARQELAQIVGATRIGSKWYLSDAQYVQVTNRLTTLTVRSAEFMDALEKSAEGRKTVHGKIVGQGIDVRLGREVVKYEDGWAYTNSFRVKTAETTAQRAARFARMAQAAAQRAKEAEAKRRAQLPQDYAKTLEARETAKSQTNVVNVTRGL